MADAADEDAEGEGFEGAEVGDVRCAGDTDEAGGDEATGEAFPGFTGAEPGDEFCAAQGASAEVGADVSEFDDQQDHEDDPCAADKTGVAVGVEGAFDAQGHEEPAEAAEVEGGEDGAGHVGDGFLGLLTGGAAEGGEEHDENDDEGEGGSSDGLEAGELGGEGVEDEATGAHHGDHAVGTDALGGEEGGELAGGEGHDDEEEDGEADAADADGGVAVAQADDAVGGVFEIGIEPEEREEAQEHEGAEGEAIAERAFHSVIC